MDSKVPTYKQLQRYIDTNQISMHAAEFTSETGQKFLAKKCNQETRERVERVLNTHYYGIRRADLANNFIRLRNTQATEERLNGLLRFIGVLQQLSEANVLRAQHEFGLSLADAKQMAAELYDQMHTELLAGIKAGITGITQLHVRIYETLEKAHSDYGIEAVYTLEDVNALLALHYPLSQLRRSHFVSQNLPVLYRGNRIAQAKHALDSKNLLLAVWVCAYANEEQWNAQVVEELKAFIKIERQHLNAKNQS